MRSEWRVWPTVCLAVSAACVEITPLQPGPNTPVIEAVLNAAVDTQYVQIKGVHGTIDVGSVEIGSAGQMTRLERRVDTLWDSSVVPGPFMYVSTGDQRILPGATYHLRVVLADGGEVAATTTVPVAQPAMTATAGTYEYRSDLRVEWEPVAGAVRYFVSIAQLQRLGSIGEPTLLVSRFADSPFTVPASALSLANGNNINLDDLLVTVAVADEHFRRYESIRTDPFSGTTLPRQLSNAYGVFGSVVPIMRQQLKLTTRPFPPFGPP